MHVNSHFENCTIRNIGPVFINQWFCYVHGYAGTCVHYLTCVNYLILYSEVKRHL